ncbi:MAG: di-trans,poly-cis-decaprenylcistransferase [Deltaproteobacteria bacterium]|nr:di-trans,poly-cis-decaprenylcistransferase [Deltaproteobacteria bacterium]
MNPPPQHIAIIMDGNGRWAQHKGLPRIVGHQHGVEAADAIVTTAREFGIPYLTLFAFSDENWGRPREEVEQLMQLLADFLRTKRDKMIANGVRLATIGETDRLPVTVQHSLAETIEATAAGTSLTLILALSYGARAEICRAVRRAMTAGISEITPDQLSAALDTAAYPDPDLLIRTSGEYRISNYLLWQLAYTELYFTDILWPDFSPEHLREAIAAYQRRERRFGRVTA